MKITSSHVIGAIFVVGILIYIFTKTKVSGTVTADESDATFTQKPDPGITSSTVRGTVSYNTELGDS